MDKDDKALFDRIVKGDEIALEFVYKKYYKLVTKLVLSNSGTPEEARDVYQDALIVFWQKARSGKLVLSSKMGTFIYGICKNLWLKELDRKKRLVSDSKNDEEGLEHDDGEKEMIISNCLNKLDEGCKKILTYFYFDGLSMQQIANQMGLANSDTAKTQKYKCKRKLDSLVKQSYTKEDFY